MTPRQPLMQMVKSSFPVHQYEDFTDTSSGTPKKGSRPALDADGNQDPEPRSGGDARCAVEGSGADQACSAGPLEILINHFGPEITAEITGRKQRVVDGRWNKTHKGGGRAPAFIQKRGDSAAQADAEAFMADRKRILIFSDAGGTGFSFHADLTQVNQRKRKHYASSQDGERTSPCRASAARTAPTRSNHRNLG